MAERNISRKVQQAAEEYLTSRGSSCAQLTDKQWEVVTECIKAQQIRKRKIINRILLAIVLAFVASLIYVPVMKVRVYAVIGDNVPEHNSETKVVVKLNQEEVAFNTKLLVIYGMGIGALALASLVLLGQAICISWQGRKTSEILNALLQPMRDGKGAESGELLNRDGQP